MINLSDIQKIIEHCHRLLSISENLRRDELTEDAYENVEQLYPSLRKLYIASLMQNKQLICISGLQGAGKTTLMKNFYGIKDDLMNVSLGRGERIPVLITEKDVKDEYITAISVVKDDNGNYSQVIKNLEKGEIIRATKGEDRSIMYLEIIVPYKHTFNDAVSFMLLPGFEKKSEYWNDLIEFSVNSSDAAVFVFNEASFSNAENENYLNRIQDRFGSNVVYAISGSDGSLDDNAQVKKTCMEVLQIKEEDRVVCVGQYNDVEKNNAWIKSFKSAIDKYAMFETQPAQRTASFVYKELLNLKDTLYTILGKLNQSDDFIPSDYHNHHLLKAFDATISKKREELVRHIKKEFEIAKGKSAKKFVEEFISRPWHKNLKRTFFGVPNVKEQYIETQEMIKASLNDGFVCLPDFHMGRAIAASIHSLDMPADNNPNAFQLLIDTQEREGKIELLETENTITALQDVYALIQVPKKGEYYTLQNSNTNRVLKAMAELVTYYYGLTSYERLAAEQTSGLTCYEPANSTLTSKDILDGAAASKKFAVGLAGIMGVDILADGSLNLISQIANSCSIALPYAGFAAILIVGAGAAAAVIKDINRMQRADVESARMAINGIYDHIQQEALDSFDYFTNMIRERIEENLADLSGVNKVMATYYNAKVEVNNLLDILDKITKDYIEDSHSIIPC